MKKNTCEEIKELKANVKDFQATIKRLEEECCKEEQDPLVDELREIFTGMHETIYAEDNGYIIEVGYKSECSDKRGYVSTYEFRSLIRFLKAHKLSMCIGFRDGKNIIQIE